MTISRHYFNVGSRRVHYRRAGKGPLLLMVHQSPRSSAEYEALMQKWAAHFTCIAPDTPGFGQSDPLPDDPEIGDFARAALDLLDALGIKRCAAYGFHSGAIILMNAIKRAPERFTRVAMGSYAVWTPGEMALFEDDYLPEFRPQPFGEHLTWLWNRILEQSWFFPWSDARGEARLSVAHDDPERVHAVVVEMLEAGNAYRAGYGAVLRAPRDIPRPHAAMPPVLITAYDGDPLQAHIDRLGDMPKGWKARKVSTPEEQQAKSLAFLLDADHLEPPTLTEASDCGFLEISTDAFSGLIHWRGARGSDALHLHAPAHTMGVDELAIDLPGHGLSDDWPGNAPDDWQAWAAVAEAVRAKLGARALSTPSAPPGEPDRLYPDLSPDRFGAYLTTAWQIVRARHFFEPWYAADQAHACDFDPAALAPDRLADEHLGLLRARAAGAYHKALQNKGEPS